MPAPLRDTPQEAVELIKSFEGIEDGDPSTVKLDPYIDPAGIWTIGWGHAIREAGARDWLRGPANKAKARALYPGGITMAQAEALLRGDLLDTVRDVQRVVTRPIDDGQFGALVAFAFNVGGGALASSTLLKKLNAGDVGAAADAFLAWNKCRVNGVLQVMRGLTRRRTAERALFLGADWRAASVLRSRVAAKKKRAVAKKAAEDVAARKSRKAAGRTAAKGAATQAAPAPTPRSTGVARGGTRAAIAKSPARKTAAPKPAAVRKQAAPAPGRKAAPKRARRGAAEG